MKPKKKEPENITYLREQFEKKTPEEKMRFIFNNALSIANADKKPLPPKKEKV